MFRRSEMVRRYQVTGGACTGLAVAFNAPLTGMAFAFEEAHKRFTPEVFICAFSSVIAGLLARTAICAAAGVTVRKRLRGLSLFPDARFRIRLCFSFFRRVRRTRRPLL